MHDVAIQDVVNEYAKNCARIKKLDERNKELKEKLVPYLQKHDCPDGGPWLLELGEEERTLFSWKTYASKLAKKLFGPAYKKKIKAAQEAAGTQTICKITPKVNSDWEE